MSAMEDLNFAHPKNLLLMIVILFIVLVIHILFTWVAYLTIRHKEGPPGRDCDSY